MHLVTFVPEIININEFTGSEINVPFRTIKVRYCIILIESGAKALPFVGLNPVHLTVVLNERLNIQRLEVIFSVIPIHEIEQF